MIEINGKVYRNIQEQVAKNQEDIEALNERIHNITLEGSHNSTFWVIKFIIRNSKQEAYTTASDIYEALEEAFPVAGQDIPCDGAVLFADHIEIPYLSQFGSTDGTFDFDWYGTNGDSGSGDTLDITWITKVVDQVL